MKYNVTMIQIAFSWQFAKGVGAPIIGVTKKNILMIQLVHKMLN